MPPCFESAGAYAPYAPWLHTPLVGSGHCVSPKQYNIAVSTPFIREESTTLQFKFLLSETGYQFQLYLLINDKGPSFALNNNGKCERGPFVNYW